MLMRPSPFMSALGFQFVLSAVAEKPLLSSMASSMSTLPLLFMSPGMPTLTVPPVKLLFPVFVSF
jgi:hypothetical protein